MVKTVRTMRGNDDSVESADDGIRNDALTGSERAK
jgi:hypothetical protein